MRWAIGIRTRRFLTLSSECPIKPFDYLIVGAGLFGAVFANRARAAGKTCLVIDKRPHIGGNIYTEVVEGIDVHRYGAHIFHTNNEAVWKFVTSFGDFNNFVNSPVANYKGRLFNLPFNMNTFYAMWGVTTPRQAQEKIARQRQEAGIEQPRNLEEQAISLVGRDIYEALIKGYTEKQWGRDCRDLPPSIIRRLPVRFLFDNNYFNAKFQGIPVAGYTELVKKLLQGIPVRLNTDYFEGKAALDALVHTVVYTGAIDRYFDYCEGALEYRRVRFETEVLETPNYQGVAVVNYTDRTVPYTRIIEHKHFAFGRQEKTVISREYSAKWKVGEDPYYPIGDEKNQALYRKYRERAEALTNVYFGGRLGTYRYLDMDKVIEEALEATEHLV